MEITYRFRFLIYLAAFMLVMSVCFVYAEPLPSHSHLLFQTAPQHAGFLATSTDEPTFDPDALRCTAPVITPVVLQQLQDATRSHHRFFHRAGHAVLRPAPAALKSASVRDLTVEPQSSVVRIR